MKQDKMYICVLDEFPDYMTPTLVAHATLRHHIQMSENERYWNWLNSSFKKCVVRVNQKEFDKIKKLPNTVLSKENNTLDGKDSCVTIIAHSGEYNVLTFAKLWNVKVDNGVINSYTFNKQISFKEQATRVWKEKHKQVGDVNE